MLIQQGDTKLSGIPLKKGKFGFPNLRDSPRTRGMPFYLPCFTMNQFSSKAIISHGQTMSYIELDKY